MENLVLFSDEKLLELIRQAKAIIESRKSDKQFIVSTYGSIDPRKHGHAYMARLTFKDGKVEREFLEGNGKSWDSKHKYYDTSYTFRAKEGDKFEARLSDGSWKSDAKVWYMVVKDENGELVLQHFSSLKTLQEA
nr:MAG TPA: hypothetical protein [Caudoviricetes sp.]